MWKNWPNKYFKNQSLEPWYLLSVELAVQYRVYDVAWGNDQEKESCYSSMDLTKLLIYMNFNGQKPIFSHFQNVFNSSSLDVPFQKKELFYSICQRQTESTYCEIQKQSFAYILVLIKVWSFKD